MRSVLNNNALNSCTFDNLKSRYRIFFNPLVMRCLVPTDRFYTFGSRQSRGAKRRGDVFAKRTQFLCSTKPMVESKLESLGIRFSEKMGAAGLRGVSVEHSPGTSAPCGSCNMLTPDAETAVTASRSAAAELDPIGAQPALVVIDGVAAIKCGPEPLESAASSDQSGIVTAPPISQPVLDAILNRTLTRLYPGLRVGQATNEIEMSLCDYRAHEA